ncbi:zinc-binding dehydrogenase [Brevibacterium ammoniilyticum]|uniref:zinc-binding dehydrogenase n=1 Tax=Brevibacterium ammoniilyticum TaxID=1046555 RepID=UPI003CC7A27C
MLGHEFGGTIVSVGEAVSPQRIGDRVAVEPLVPDWTSREARSGRYNIDPSQKFFGVPGLDGGLQEFVSVPSENAHSVPDNVSDDASAMVETVSVALNGIEKAGVRLGDRVLVAGGGPVGLFVVQLCRLAGASRIGLVEPQAFRGQRGAELGAEVYSDLASAPDDQDSFIECTGIDSVRHDGFFHVRPGGRMVFIGVGSASASVPMSAVIEREVTLHGVMRYAFTWPKVVEFIASGGIDADGLVSRSLAFADARLAWSEPQNDEIKTMIRVS